MVNVTGDDSMGLSEKGYASLRSVAEIVFDADLWPSAVTFGDVYRATLQVYKEAIARRVAPENAEDVVALLRPIIEPEIKAYSYIYPVYGIDGAKAPLAMTLGSATLHHQLDSALRGVKEHSPRDRKMLAEAMRRYSWIHVRASGTRDQSERQALRIASHITGVLAVLAGCTYEGGASAFRIGVTSSAETALGLCRWGFWSDEDRSLGVSMQLGRAQLMELTPGLFDRATGEHTWQALCALIEKSDRTETEQAICRAIYWYSDAHREGDPTMQLIKYWSCIEAFFTLQNEQVTEAVSSGIAAVLVYGPYPHPMTPPFGELRKEAKRLYALRSKALHHGYHDACEESDSARLSQFVAWMLLNIWGLNERGYGRLKDLSDQCGRLAKLEPGTEDGGPADDEA